MSLDSKAKLLGRGASLLVLTVGLTAAVGLGSAVGCGGDSDSGKGGSGAGGSPSGSSTSNTGGSTTEPTTSTTTTSQENGGGGSGNGGSSANGGSNAGGSNAGGAGGGGGSGPASLVATCAAGGKNLLSGIVAWYHAENNANDAYGNNNGTAAAGVEYGVGTLGAVGSGFLFSGTATSYVSVPSSASLSPTKAITLEAWVNPTALGGRFINKITNFGHDGYLLDNQGGKLRMIVGTHTLSSAASLATGTWTHVAGVYDGANMTVYINGVASGTVAAADAIPVNAFPLILGADEGGTNGFKGFIDEVRIHDRGFTAAEVATLHGAGAARNSPTAGQEMYGWFSGDTASLDDDVLRILSGTAGVGVTSTAGIMSTAQLFPGSANAFSQTPNSVVLASFGASGALAMDAWIKPTAAGGRIFDRMTPAGSNGFMLDTFGGNLRFIVGGSTVTSATSLPLNTWTHVAATYDKVHMTIYINGVVAGTLAKSDAIPTNTLALTIGGDSAGGSRFTGAIDEARLYSRSFSQADVTALYDETHCQ
jgi:hypothetical protein